MKVFISWSGDASHAMAKGLAEWLPTVIQVIRPFLSSSDIQKGRRWFEEIGLQLDSTNYGILCITRSNLLAPWIHFEAGALSKRMEIARVVPLLIDVKTADLQPPLSNLNAVTSLTKEEVRKLLVGMNAALEKDSLPEKVLERSFERAWPDFEKIIVDARTMAQGEAKAKNLPKERSVENILEEVLLLVRELSQQRYPTFDPGTFLYPTFDPAVIRHQTFDPNAHQIIWAPVTSPSSATLMMAPSTASAVSSAASTLQPSPTTNPSGIAKPAAKDDE